MDYFKITDWASKYLAGYFTVFFSVLKNPAPASSPADDENDSKLNSDLIGFALVSITIGATINSVIPNRPSSAEVLTTSIVTLIMWIVYSMVIFMVLSLLRSQISLLNVLTNCLQLFGTVYVVSNLLAFLWGMATINPLFFAMRDAGPIIKMIFDRPFLAFYFFQVILLFFYLPKVISRLKGLGSLRVIFATFTTLLFIFFCGFSPYLSDLLMLGPTVSGDDASAVSGQEADTLKLDQPVEPTMTIQPTEPTAKPTVIVFLPGPDTPSYVSSTLFHPELDCNWAGIGGTVVDVNDNPIIGVVVVLRGTLNGSTVDQQNVSGINKEYGPSGFEFVIGNAPIASDDTLYLQLLDLQGTPISDQVYFATSPECDKNLVLVKLRKN